MVRLFWVKMSSWNHFHPNPHVWLQRKISFFRKSFPVDQYLLLWPGNNFTLLFSVQIFSREREREREREERAQIGERERERKKREPTIDERRARRSRPSLIAPLVGRSHRSRLQSCLHRAISSSPPLHDLNMTRFDEFFCWVLLFLWMSVELIHYCMFTVEEVSGKLGM